MLKILSKRKIFLTALSIFSVLIFIFIFNGKLFTDTNIREYYPREMIKPKGIYYVYGDIVNARNKPTLNSETIFTVKAGEEVMIIYRPSNSELEQIGDVTDYWYYIKYRDKIGYIWGGLIANTSVIQDFDYDGQAEQILMKHSYIGIEPEDTDHLIQTKLSIRAVRNNIIIDEYNEQEEAYVYQNKFNVYKLQNFEPSVHIFSTYKESYGLEAHSFIETLFYFYDNKINKISSFNQYLIYPLMNYYEMGKIDFDSSKNKITTSNTCLTNDPEDNFLTYEDYAPNNPNAVEIYHDREKVFIWSNGKFNKQYLTFNYYIKDILS